LRENGTEYSGTWRTTIKLNLCNRFQMSVI